MRRLTLAALACGFAIGCSSGHGSASGSASTTASGATQAPSTPSPILRGPTVGTIVSLATTSPTVSATTSVTASFTAAALTASLDFEVEVPSWTPAGQVWIACDVPLGTTPAWSANGWGLTQNSAGRWVGSMPVAPGAVVHAKITRGTWATVEKGPVIDEVANRTLTAGQGSTHCYMHVFHWADDTIPNSSGDVNDLGVFTPTNGLQPRTVVSHLPPGYFDPANANVSYPVLYALDGQNLFDPSLSFSGVAWGLDTAADGNVTRGRGAFIAIGIYNTNDRMNEYTPSYDSSVGAGGKLEDLATWLFTELKPAIDALYRTSPSPDDTGLMGSSLGGLASLTIGFNHSDQVHRIAALSPSLWWNNQCTLALIQGTTQKPPLTIWLDIGTNEDGSNSGQIVQQTEAVLNALQNLGFVQTQDLAYEEAPGAQHNEAAWAARLPDVLSFLFP